MAFEGRIEQQINAKVDGKVGPFRFLFERVDNVPVVGRFLKRFSVPNKQEAHDMGQIAGGTLNPIQMILNMLLGGKDHLGDQASASLKAAGYGVWADDVEKGIESAAGSNNGDGLKSLLSTDSETDSIAPLATPVAVKNTAAKIFTPS